MQIMQFVFGTSVAASYLFIYYSIPFPAAVEATPGMRHVTSTAIPSDPETATTAPAASAAGQLILELKKIALRAVGAAGTAENVATGQQTLEAGAVSTAAGSGVEYRMHLSIDTSGQAFAIWLNVMYLLPLTYLFVRFFIRSYLYRKDPATKLPPPMLAAEKAGMDALKGVSREMHKTVTDMGDERNGKA